MIHLINAKIYKRIKTCYLTCYKTKTKRKTSMDQNKIPKHATGNKRTHSKTSESKHTRQHGHKHTLTSIVLSSNKKTTQSKCFFSERLQAVQGKVIGVA